MAVVESAPGKQVPPFALWLGALGVVYGDIGTSPLYALRECFHGPHRVPATPDNILGVLSLIVWSLIVVVSLKYLALVMRADNDGEGGILALLALVATASRRKTGFGSNGLLAIGLFGAALLYGDGMITPAISVLSAIEGLEVAAPGLEPFVVPLAAVLLLTLFLVQKHGTQRIGSVFGPLMLLWFVVIGLLGAWQVALKPSVLSAFNPWHGFRFFVENGIPGFLVLGVVFLVVTGGEALYADMGHFGRGPIRRAWFSVVLPGLTLNYFGQGALLLEEPGLTQSPFFHLVEGIWKYPFVVLAAVATLIASQAVISGAFSLTMQAVQLGYLPRVEIRHTSESEFGQIYVPLVNWVLMAATLGLAVGFGSSSGLASAYGMAVTTTMAITTVLAFFAMRRVWRWPFPIAALVAFALLVVDLSFLGANLTKILDGGWLPLAVGILIVVLMTTWRRGRQLLADRLSGLAVPYDELFRRWEGNPPSRIPGAEVHMSSSPDRAPHTLLLNLKHYGVLHRQVVVVTVLFEKAPFVASGRRVELEPLRENLNLVRIRCGFMQRIDVPQSLRSRKLEKLKLNPSTTTYVLGRETILATKRPGMAIWRERLFAFMSRNARKAADYFAIPASQVLEVGSEIEM